MRTRICLSLALSVLLAAPALAQEKPMTAQEALELANETPAASTTNEGAASGGELTGSAPAGTSEAAGDTHGDSHAASDDGSHAHGAAHFEKQDWSFKGPFGTYDRAALQRGSEVYRQVCAACHSMDRLSYRDLMAVGYTEDQVKAIAGDATIIDGPNDEGEMFERPGRPSDRFKAPFANRKAAMYANNGAYPPDLSLIAKARHGGADYIYGILTGYAEPPAGKVLLPGQNWNNVMPGNIIAMASPLADGMISYEDGTEGTLDQYARDVAQYLAWASEPHMEIRKRTGIKAFLFLLVFTAIMYGVKKRVWKNAH